MTPETARCFALMLAAQARVAGMQAENAQREACGGLQINFDGDQLKIETINSEPFKGYIDELRVEKGAPKVSVPFNLHEPLGINAKWLK